MPSVSFIPKSPLSIAYIPEDNPSITFNAAQFIERKDQLGGSPTFSSASSSTSLPHCQKCQNQMCLYFQIQTFLGKSERWLYLFGCLQKACSNSPFG